MKGILVNVTIERIPQKYNALHETALSTTFCSYDFVLSKATRGTRTNFAVIFFVWLNVNTVGAVIQLYQLDLLLFSAQLSIIDFTTCVLFVSCG